MAIHVNGESAPRNNWLSMWMRNQPPEIISYLREPASINNMINNWLSYQSGWRGSVTVLFENYIRTRKISVFYPQYKSSVRRSLLLLVSRITLSFPFLSLHRQKAGRGKQVNVPGSSWAVNPKPAAKLKCHEKTVVAANGDTTISFQWLWLHCQPQTLYLCV